MRRSSISAKSSGTTSIETTSQPAASASAASAGPDSSSASRRETERGDREDRGPQASDAVATAAVATNPAFDGLVSRFSIGKSYENRDLWATKVSDNVAADENEPEVLFTCGQHAREHLTIEMCLYVLNELLSKYTSDARVRGLVDSREIWIVFNVNPDGAEYDVATGSYRSWRKNRQPNAGSTAVGTDLNRNFAYNWGCCGGSSGTFSSETYRGASAFSAPETQRIRDFVNSRVVGGVQQIKTGIDFHTYSELVLWPFGYTTADTAPGLTQDDRDAFAVLGGQMAATNGYTPEQSSDLYITDGSIDDWLWGVHKIFGYTFEMYPRSSNPGFYPPDEVIGRRDRRATARPCCSCSRRPTARTRRSASRRSTAAPRRPTTVFSDDFEADRGWTVNASGTDTATLGRFERGDPAQTTSSGVKQLGTTVSGVNDLVTGRVAGASAGEQDVDGGVTSMRSPAIALPAGKTSRLSFSYYLAHGSNSSVERLPARARRRRHDLDGVPGAGRGEQRQRRVGVDDRRRLGVRGSVRADRRRGGRRRAPPASSRPRSTT